MTDQTSNLQSLTSRLRLTLINAAVRPTSGPVDTQERVNLIQKFIDNDLEPLIEAGKRLLSPPFQLSEPLEFVRVASSAVQSAFSDFTGQDRRVILLDTIEYLSSGPLKPYMGSFGWLLNPTLLGWIYDNFVKPKLK